MAYVMVTDDEHKDVLLDERVDPEHLSDEERSLQIIERIARAVSVAAPKRADAGLFERRRGLGALGVILRSHHARE